MKIWTSVHRKFMDFLADKGKLTTDGSLEVGTSLTVGTDIATTAGNITSGNGYLKISGDTGQSLTIARATDLCDVATATGHGTGTVTTAVSLPATSIILAVNSHITTVIVGSTAVSWSLGISGHTDHYGTGLAFTDELDTYSGVAGTAACQTPHWNATAAPLIITPNAGSLTSGVIRIDVWYIQIPVATS